MWKEIIQTWKSDNLLTQAWEMSYEMLDISREMFLEAVRILRESNDTEIKETIRSKDKIINKYEREVRRKVMTHCTLQSSIDLTGGMILISIVIDIERIGDYVKNILELAIFHPQHLSGDPYDKSLTEIEQGMKDRFHVITDILKENDVETAQKVIAEHKAGTRQICDQIVEDLVRGDVPGISPIDSAALVLYARYLKRISSHLNNIVTSVVNPFDRIGFKVKKG